MKRIVPIRDVRRERLRNLRRYHDHRYELDARVRALEWEAGGIVWQIDLDAREHLTDEWDREHYGSFVMPFETELNIDDFARPPSFDPFMGPRSFNGPPL